MSFLAKLKQSKYILSLYKKIFNSLTILPKQKNLIIFESFNGRQYSDNPRAIYEYMKEHYPHYHMVWSVDRRFMKQFEPHDVDIATKFSLKWLWLMPRAKYWVTNSRFPQWFNKSKETVYLQTWHGTPLKRLGIDIEEVHMPGTDTETYKENFIKEAAKWDYLVSPNRYSTDIFKRAFGFKGEMLESGYPRNDYLVNQNSTEEKHKLGEKLQLPRDKKVILYAPTWRDNEFYDKGKYKFDLHLNLKQMQVALGDEYVVLLRLHYLVAENMDLSDVKGFAYDVSSYEDIRELYLLSDLLITDYSSVFFDYSILDRPILFYVYDIDNYRDSLRGFYFDIENHSPGPLLKETEEVISAIKGLELVSSQYADKRKEFKEEFAQWEDGNATKRIVEHVFQESLRK